MQTNVIQGEAPFKLVCGNMGTGIEKSIPADAVNTGRSRVQVEQLSG